MRRPRFTLGQLMIWVAAAALFFAGLRSPFGGFVLLTAPILIGFAIGRARGKTGFTGALLAGSITGVAVCSFAVLDQGFNFLSPKPYAWILGFAMAGLVHGAIVGGVAFVVMGLMDPAWDEPPIESFRSFDGSGLARNGRPPLTSTQGLEDR